MENPKEDTPTTTSDLLMEVDKAYSKLGENENGNLNVNKESDVQDLGNAQTEEAASESNTEMASELIQSAVSADSSKTLDVDVITEKMDSFQAADVEEINDASVIDYNLEVLPSDVIAIDTSEQINEFTLPNVQDLTALDDKESPTAPDTEEIVTALNIEEQVTDTVIKDQPTTSGAEDQVTASVSEGHTSNVEDKANASNVEDEVNASNVEDEANVSNVEDEANASNVEDETNASNVEDEANASNSEDKTNASNVEDDANPLNIEDQVDTSNDKEPIAPSIEEQPTAEISDREVDTEAPPSSDMEQTPTLSVEEATTASDNEEKVSSPSVEEQITVSNVEENALSGEKNITTTLSDEQEATEVISVESDIPEVIQDKTDEPKLDESPNNCDNKKSDSDDIANNESDSQDKDEIRENDYTNHLEVMEVAKVGVFEIENDSENSAAQDPIASDSGDLEENFESGDNQEGADAELCIIPDTEREISQEEKDAASSIPPLKDLTEAGTSNQSENSSEQQPSEKPDESDEEVILLKYNKDDLNICDVCKVNKKVSHLFSTNENLTKYICGEKCLETFKTHHKVKIVSNWVEGSLRVKNFSDSVKDALLSFVRKCATCKKAVSNIESVLNWEIMDFCNEFCLTKYQKEIGSHCASCNDAVQGNSLGKYCVRFGNDIRQFCTSVCLEDYKKGLKVCSYCQQDMMSTTQAGFLAPVGDKGQFKDFCSQLCMDKYDIMTNDKPPNVPAGTTCSVCKQQKPIAIEFEHNGALNYFCQERCLVAFNFVNNISSGKCGMCRRHFLKTTLEKHTMYYDNVQHSFCSNSCENIYIIAHRKIVPCSWCKVKKYNFDMIRRYCKDGVVINMCSVNCLSLYQVSINAANSKQTNCNICQKFTQPFYHITMSDATIRNFCSYNCVMSFQSQFNKETITISDFTETNPVPTGAPKKNKKHPDNVPFTNEATPLPVISHIHSLATNGSLGPLKIPPPPLSPINARCTRSKSSSITSTQVLNSTPQVLNSLIEIPRKVQLKQHFIIRPAPLPKQRNVATMCYTHKVNKSITAKPEMVDQEVQTEERKASKILIPIPIPVYVPTPMQMYCTPTPVPIPFPVPIPVPVFIPTTRNSAAGIMKEIKKIQVKIPTDPYEAEILMMAEMVAEEKKEDTTDSESDVDDTGGPEDSYSPEPVDASNAFGDDMLQMALKMATELDEPAVDLEGALTANTITAPQGGEAHGPDENVEDPPPMHHHLIERSQAARRRKRGIKQPRGNTKRKRKMFNNQVDMPMMQHQVQQPPPPPEPVEKPDANMCLKYTFGVNAWKQWVTTKNGELEKSSRRTAVMPKLFKTEILQLTADELNYSLCLFVKEVRKPNGAEYAPDTIYYLCLGIQQYLFENGRIDNIFCDAFYEKFTDCLDEVAKKFSVLYNDSHYIVTRVEEEHLWESKQLGAHSPHVLLSTLMFFNTKHFNLTSVDEHMQLSFSHIMKHWKRNPNQPGSASKIPGARNVLLRFYPPQSAIQNNARKKKVYEQQENEENPLRCPVKLYEFYLSKCPESVKTRNDVFYLQPERSCVPDSPVWYSTMPLPREALEKMLHRVKMVKEINVALLTS